jgi:hypothetical protein
MQPQWRGKGWLSEQRGDLDSCHLYVKETWTQKRSLEDRMP